MSVKAISWALDEVAGLHPTQKLVLVVLAEVAQTDGTAAFVSHKTIGEKVGISDRQAREHLKALEEAGLIERGDQRRAAYIPAQYRPVVYDLNMNGSDRLGALMTGRKPTSVRKPTSGLDRKPSAPSTEVRAEAHFRQTVKPENNPSGATATLCVECSRPLPLALLDGAGRCPDCLPHAVGPYPEAGTGRAAVVALLSERRAKLHVVQASTEAEEESR